MEVDELTPYGAKEVKGVGCGWNISSRGARGAALRDSSATSKANKQGNEGADEQAKEKAAPATATAAATAAAAATASARCPATRRALELGASANAFKELPVRCLFYARETDGEGPPTQEPAVTEGQDWRRPHEPVEGARDIWGRGEMRLVVMGLGFGLNPLSATLFSSPALLPFLPSSPSLTFSLFPSLRTSLLPLHLCTSLSLSPTLSSSLLGLRECQRPRRVQPECREG